MKYCVLDAETTIRNRGDEAVGDNKASPYHPDNHVVVWGWKSDQHKRPVIENMITGIPAPFFTEAGFIVGQNVKFDLTYLRKTWPDDFERWVRGGGRIWDTQTVEYLLTAQQSKMVSLDKLALKYGGTLKDDRLKEYWDAGIDTTEIPEEILIPYLEQDVLNTELVFLKQLAKARELRMVPLILSQMDAVLCTAEMQWNGMHFNKPMALEEAANLKDELAAVRQDAINLMSIAAPELPEPNPSSNDQISQALFGGTIITYQQMPIVGDDGEYERFKTGQRKGEVKTRKTAVPISFNGFQCKPKQEWLTGKQGIYQTGDDILKAVAKKNKGDAALFIEKVLRIRALEKDLSTYFVGLSDLCWHDGKIRGEHNHCVTVTGRLSSSKPNMQNISNKERD